MTHAHTQVHTHRETLTYPYDYNSHSSGHTLRMRILGQLGHPSLSSDWPQATGQWVQGTRRVLNLYL